NVAGRHGLAPRLAALVDLLDPAVAGVGDVQVGSAVADRDSGGLVQERTRGRGTVAGAARGAGVAGDLVHVPGGHADPEVRAAGRGHDQDPVVAGIGDDHVPVRVE